MSKPRKPKPPVDAAQSARFISTAKELGADEGGESFERAMKSVAPPLPAGGKPDGKRKPKG